MDQGWKKVGDPNTPGCPGTWNRTDTAF